MDIATTTGYAAQIPQLLAQANIKYFLTQKLSWNQFNKFPHNTFLWEGIDGSRVLTHFPPADNYCSHANVSDIRKSETNFKDKERSSQSLLVYGHGDGGGGPNPGMRVIQTTWRARCKRCATDQACFGRW
jgi:alpha-mannosidase